MQQPICTNADALCSAKTGRLQLLTALKSNNLYYFDNSSYNYKHLLYYNISLKKIMNAKTAVFRNSSKNSNKLLPQSLFKDQFI